MRHCSIMIIFLMVGASLAGCTANEVVTGNNDGSTNTGSGGGGTTTNNNNTTTNNTGTNNTTNLTEECVVLLQIIETATQAPGNTSWTNNTYDSDCNLIKTTTDGRISGGIGGGGTPYSPDFWVLNFDLKGNIISSNFTSAENSQNPGYQQFSNTTYYYDVNDLLVSIKYQTTAVSVDGGTGEIYIDHYDPWYSNYSYDSSGREIMMINDYGSDPAGLRWHNTTYNQNGLIETYTADGNFEDANHNTTYYYDSNDVLIQIYSDNALQMGECYSNFTYDSGGLLTQIWAEYGWGDLITNTTYDADGRVSIETIAFDAPDYSMHYFNTRTHIWGEP